MIKNIIFDIGNVLADFRWQGFLKDRGFDGQMAERIGAASVLGGAWDEFDRGAWSEERLLEAFIARDPDIEEEIRRAFKDLRGMVTRREYAIPWIRSFKAAGYKVYYLSNFSEKAYLECRDALDFIPEMDGGILSYRERLVKPDPAIYTLLTERYGLRQQECVFLDDTQKNVEGAKRVGMSGIHFIDREQATQELAKMGVVV